jgi:formate dehydrogenase accessory protein FdhE
MLECPFHGTIDARPVTKLSPWQRRIQRANELSRQHSFAAEILGFYIHVARFQESLHRHLVTVLQSTAPSMDRELSQAELTELSSQFESFLSMVEERGPVPLAELTRDLRRRGRPMFSELLADAWRVSSPSDAQGFLAHAFLQPYAEFLRSRGGTRTLKQIYAVCPFCNRKPSFGVLRQMGDGAARSLVCSFCLNEWEFRRVVCPGCGEENDKKLPVFTADEFDYIRVECCDTCRTYIKSIDLTKNGNAEPIVDELSSAPLDLWAREHGYAKLQSNIFGM